MAQKGGDPAAKLPCPLLTHCLVPKVSENLVQRDGDFLVRDSLSSPGNFVLTCQWKNLPQHFKIRQTVLRLSEAYSRVQYQLEMESFDSIPGLVRCYVGNRRPVSQQSGAIIFQPVNRTVPLRCLEERYGPNPGPTREGSLAQRRPDAAKRLSLTVSGTHAREQSLPRGNLLRWVRAPPVGLGGGGTLAGAGRTASRGSRGTMTDANTTPGGIGVAVAGQRRTSSPLSWCLDEMMQLLRKEDG